MSTKGDLQDTKLHNSAPAPPGWQPRKHLPTCPASSMQSPSRSHPAQSRGWALHSQGPGASCTNTRLRDRRRAQEAVPGNSSVMAELRSRDSPSSRGASPHHLKSKERAQLSALRNGAAELQLHAQHHLNSSQQQSLQEAQNSFGWRRPARSSAQPPTQVSDARSPSLTHCLAFAPGLLLQRGGDRERKSQVSRQVLLQP